MPGMKDGGEKRLEIFCCLWYTASKHSPHKRKQKEDIPMSYQDTYEAWLNSPALSAQEKAELESIRTDEKEKESRFFDQLSFGTAGLRGTMGVGLYRMNVHVIRHATQAFAQVIWEEGEKAAARGVAICFDCRNNSQTFGV